MAGQGFLEIAAGPAGRIPGHAFRRADRDDLASAIAAFGTEIEDPVGGLHDVEIVFDDHDGVAVVDQFMQHLQQFADIFEGLPDPAVATADALQLSPTGSWKW